MFPSFKQIVSPIPFIIVCAVLALTGCKKDSAPADSDELQAALQQFREARLAKDTERALAIVDSLESAEEITATKADYLRGRAYDSGWKMQIAEHYYQKANQSYRKNPSESWLDYTDSGYRWAYLRFARGDTEGAVTVLSDLLAQSEGNKAFPKSTKSALLMLMASCQMQLHQKDEACRNWQKAYEVDQQYRKEESNGQPTFPWISMSISENLFEMGDLAGAQEWLDRCEQEFVDYEQKSSDSLIVEEWRGHIALKRALYLQATGHKAEAAATYAAIPSSRIFEPRGYVEAADYLMAVGRYSEATYWYEQLDSTYLATDGAKMTFDVIASRLSPLYLAYRKAKRNDDALHIADSISISIDSALVWQKKNNAAELAVIYQTHERDMQLKDLRFSVSMHRVIGIAGLLIILLIGYLLWRTYRTNRVLRSKNRKLLAAIREREREEQEAIKQLKTEPEETLNDEQQLYCRICELLDTPEHIYTDASMDRARLAQLLGTNEHYVSDAVNVCCNGKNVTGLINEYRVRYAANLLATTKDSVGVIAELSGFSRSSFFRIFVDEYGMSPSEYRKVTEK